MKLMFCDIDYPYLVVDDVKFIGDGNGNTKTINGWVVNGAWNFSYDCDSGEFTVVEHKKKVDRFECVRFIEIPKEIRHYNDAFDWWHDGMPPIAKKEPQKFDDEIWDDDIPF